MQGLLSSRAKTHKRRSVPKPASGRSIAARFDPEALAPCAARRHALQILVQPTCGKIQRVDDAGRWLDADERPVLGRPDRYGPVVRAEPDLEALRCANDGDRRPALPVSH